jgi:predicted transcriptional regulator
MTTAPRPLSLDEVTLPTSDEASDDVREWQAKKIKSGLKAADEGRFASPEAVRAVIQKYIPNG